MRSKHRASAESPHGGGHAPAGEPRLPRAPQRRPWRAAALLAVFSLSLGAGCGGASTEDLPTAPPSATALNPDGVPYPDDHLGLQARRGSVRGDRIANLAFRGVRGGGASSLESLPDVLSLADYYDPTQQRHRALYLVGAAGWCAICRRVMGELERQQQSLQAQGATVLVVLVNGDSHGRGPSLADFDSWRARHPLPFDLGADVGARQLSAYGLEAVPFNLLIDPRTMEILNAAVGEPTFPDYVEAALQFVRESPPSYP